MRFSRVLPMLKIVGHLGRAFRNRRQNRSSAYTPAELEAPHDQLENTKPATHKPRSACQNHSLSTTNAAEKIRPLSPNLCPHNPRPHRIMFRGFQPKQDRSPRLDHNSARMPALISGARHHSRAGRIRRPNVVFTLPVLAKLR